jgi:hypothetical protein
MLAPPKIVSNGRSRADAEHETFHLLSGHRLLLIPCFEGWRWPPSLRGPECKPSATLQTPAYIGTILDGERGNEAAFGCKNFTVKWPPKRRGWKGSPNGLA